MSDYLPPGDHLRSLFVGDLRRQYLLHVPPGPSRPRPVVLLLHGTGGTMRWTQGETRFGAFADRMDFVAVYPQGLPPDPTAPTKFIANPPAWNDGDSHRPGRPTFDDIGFIRALLDDLPVHTPVDASRIYASGFSSGAAMTFRLAAELGERFAAIAPVAGYCRVHAVECAVPTFFVIGADDPMVPPHGGKVKSPWAGAVVERPPVSQSLDRWAKLMGCTPPSVLERETDDFRLDRYPGPVDFVVMTITGLGHHWPAGRGQLKKKLAGHPSDRVDGNEVIWEFFQRHPGKFSPSPNG